MGKQKPDNVWSNFMVPFMTGNGSYMNNSNKNRLVLMERMYIRVLSELSANRFKWHGLPSTVDERFLELTLLHQGGILFYRFPETVEFSERYLVSPFANQGNVNHYDNPTRFRPVAARLPHTRELMPHEAVPIWSNYMRTPDMDILYIYAHKLAQLDRTIEINVANSRHNKLVQLNETQRLTYQNIMRQFDEGQPAVYTDPSIDAASFGAVDFGPHHETLPNLLMTKVKMWSECLTLLGVSVVNQEKKERMVTGEVDASQDQAAVTRNISLNSRKIACDQINELFPDLDVSVEWMSTDEAYQPERVLGSVADMDSFDSDSYGEDDEDDEDEDNG